jgi:hypothetical protein
VKTNNFDIAEIDFTHLATALGYGKNQAIPEQVSTMIKELLPRLPKKIQSVSMAATIERCAEEFVVTSQGVISSPAFSKLAQNAESILYGVATAGHELDKLIESSEDSFEALLIDAYGSVLVEQGVELLLECAAKEHGKFISLPFSPGYCDFPLAENRNLFAVFDALDKNQLSIQYHHQSYMMSPVKTISFVAALGNVPLDVNPCSLCTLETCQTRR